MMLMQPCMPDACGTLPPLQDLTLGCNSAAMATVGQIATIVMANVGVQVCTWRDNDLQYLCPHTHIQTCTGYTKRLASVL